MLTQNFFLCAQEQFSEPLLTCTPREDGQLDLDTHLDPAKLLEFHAFLAARRPLRGAPNHDREALRGRGRCLLSASYRCCVTPFAPRRFRNRS